MFRNIIILFLILAIGGLVLSWLKRPKALFEIRVGEDDVLILGPVPNRSQAEVRAYVRDLRLPVGARIVGTAHGTDYRLAFSSTVRQDDRELVRRFIRG
ncbi:MAG: hypothetical protein EP329_24190 [Deltaproteobacteria bacterium]|nr:MAG: hypothetical protein EP329_24190 [Deltaproteobacteria bacterium]